MRLPRIAAMTIATPISISCSINVAILGPPVAIIMIWIVRATVATTTFATTYVLASHVIGAANVLLAHVAFQLS